MIYVNILTYDDAPSDLVQLCNLIKEHYEDSEQVNRLIITLTF